MTPTRIRGSFRDPSGYLFRHDDTVYRAVLCATAIKNSDRLQGVLLLIKLFYQCSRFPRHSITLAMTTLDRTIEEQEFPPPQLIKLDVQGYELEVLKGATRALASAEFVLLEVSVWQYNENSPLIEEVVAFMSGAGFVTYDVFDINRLSDGTLLQLDVLFIRKDSFLLDEKRVVYA